jgi:hypothetical protein
VPMAEYTDRMPMGFVIAAIGWLCLVGLFGWMVIACAFEGKWGGVPVWMGFTTWFGAAFWVLLNRSMQGWWFSRFVSHICGIISAVPFLFAVGFIVYFLLGGRVEAQLSYVARLLSFLGLFCVVPAALFWGIYFSTNSQGVRQYCRVCPHCVKRITAPINLLFNKFACDECPPAD